MPKIIVPDTLTIRLTEVDTKNYKWLNSFKWRIQTRNDGLLYVVRWDNVLKSTIYMHREILHAKQDQDVDHRNGDTLLNRERNLRFCTVAQNGMNKRSNTNSSSRYKGVSFRIDRPRCWTAKIGIRRNGQEYTKYLGSYKVEEDAARAYNKAALKYFGEFALLNEIKLNVKETS